MDNCAKSKSPGSKEHDINCLIREANSALNNLKFQFEEFIARSTTADKRKQNRGDRTLSIQLVENESNTEQQQMTDQLDSSKGYACARCKTYLASGGQIVSTSFRGSTGKAYLFRSTTTNLAVGVEECRNMVTGVHVIRDVSCNCCATKLGWMYEFALEPDQAYKEGHTVLEQKLIEPVVRQDVGSTSWSSPEKDSASGNQIPAMIFASDVDSIDDLIAVDKHYEKAVEIYIQALLNNAECTDQRSYFRTMAENRQMELEREKLKREEMFAGTEQQTLERIERERTKLEESLRKNIDELFYWNESLQEALRARLNELDKCQSEYRMLNRRLELSERNNARLQDQIHRRFL